MLSIILQKIVSKKIYDYIEEWLPLPFMVNSFDCARYSMGVSTAEIDHTFLLPKLIIEGTAEEKLTLLEAHMIIISKNLDNLIRIPYLSVWNLGKVEQAWEAAPPLKEHLNKIDTPDALLYEFQMSLNDKSRMISTMLAYHYSGLPTVRIAPTAKNTMCIAKNVTKDQFFLHCPISANKKITANGKKQLLGNLIFAKRARNDLTIQTFLQHFTDTYKANKQHTSASLEWWSSIFKTDMTQIPKANLDDAADAFIQVLAAIKKRLL